MERVSLKFNLATKTFSTNLHQKELYKSIYNENSAFTLQRRTFSKELFLFP